MERDLDRNQGDVGPGGAKQGTEIAVPEGIEVVTTYRVAGASFGDLDKAIEYKGKHDLATSINEMLPRAVDKGSDYTNGGGYVQQRAEAVELYKDALGEAIKKYAGEDLAQKFMENPTSAYVSRMLNETDPLLADLQNRLHCMDSNLREWGQPYFASHPSQGKQREWPNVA
jgi:hypothetical protein